MTSSVVVGLWVPRRASSHGSEESVLRPREGCSGLKANRIVPVRTRGYAFYAVGVSHFGRVVHSSVSSQLLATDTPFTCL